ncbi:peptidase domain-containing ABC transporter, partial [Levilactobacillus brevis]|uniref:peptidase domain-containing ABC transporter n=1 Tax=Levilactobacillus brevis TaxID=1580 RepID=UPI0004668B7F
VNLGVLYVGSRMAISGQLRVGELIAFNTISSYFLNPVEELLGLQNELQMAKVANSRLNQIILAEPEIEVGTKKMVLRRNSEIYLQHVSFEYKYGQHILEDICLGVRVNEPLAIVGLSGSGKTTIAKLLAGFYKPTEGIVTVDGVNVSKFCRSSVRSNIAYLPQTPYIFSGSVLENILLGRKSDGDPLEVATYAAEVAEIDHDIRQLPDGYNTILSENSGLSGGQLQRISIARMVASDASIIIMDESTSNLDVLTESKVFSNLMGIDGKTLIFIAHRLEIAKKINHIVLIDEGNVIEEGTHDELMSKHGDYYSLWNGIEK